MLECFVSKEIECQLKTKTILYNKCKHFMCFSNKLKKIALLINFYHNNCVYKNKFKFSNKKKKAKFV